MILFLAVKKGRVLMALDVSELETVAIYNGFKTKIYDYSSMAAADTIEDVKKQLQILKNTAFLYNYDIIISEVIKYE